METPTCFISYSWDSEQHQKWVRDLATQLRSGGVNAKIDQFCCSPGEDLTKFMEESIRESNFVVLICTPKFAAKANAGIGGVGYEKAIISGKIFTDNEKATKFIPILREGEKEKSFTKLS